MQPSSQPSVATNPAQGDAQPPAAPVTAVDQPQPAQGQPAPATPPAVIPEWQRGSRETPWYRQPFVAQPAAQPTAVTPPAAPPVPVDLNASQPIIQPAVTTVAPAQPPAPGQQEIPLTQAMNDPTVQQVRDADLAAKQQKAFDKRMRADSGEGPAWYAAPFAGKSPSAPPAVDPNQPTNALLWNDYSIYTTNVTAYSKNAITPEQNQLSTNIATNLVQQASGGNPNQVAVLQSTELAQVMQQAGIQSEKLSAAQLESATLYINSAGSAAQQKDRLTASLTALQGVQAAQAKGEPLAPSTEVMKGQLVSATGVDPSAFDIMNAQEFKAKYDEVVNQLQQPGVQQMRIGQFAGTVNVASSGQLRDAQWSLDTQQKLTTDQMKQALETRFQVPQVAFKKWGGEMVEDMYNKIMTASTTPGNHEFQIRKRKVSFSVDANGQISNLKNWREAGTFEKVIGPVLTVASFVPIPVVAAAARIVSGVLAARNAANAKNFFGVVAGAASAIGGVGALVGSVARGAVAATANTVAKGLNVVSKVAYGIQAGAEAVKADNPFGVVRATVDVVGTLAGAAGKGAEAFGKVAGDIGKWVGRAETAMDITGNVKNNKGWENSLIKGVGLVADTAGDLRKLDGTFAPIGQAAGKLSDFVAPAKQFSDQYGDVVKDGTNLVRAIRDGSTDKTVIYSGSMMHRLFNPDYAPSKPEQTDKKDPTSDKDDAASLLDITRSKPENVGQAIADYGVDALRAWEQVYGNGYQRPTNLALRLGSDLLLDNESAIELRKGAKPMVDAANDANELRRAQENVVKAEEKASQARAKGDVKAETEALIEVAKAKAKFAETSAKIIEKYPKSEPVPDAA